MPRPSNKITAKQTADKADDGWYYLVVFLCFLGGVVGGGAASLPV